MLSKSEVKKIFNKYSKKVRVSCDECYAHSAGKGCLVGDQAHIDIMKLVERPLHL